MESIRPTRRLAFVNGYGATDDLQDGNYRRYLCQVFAFLADQGGEWDVYLAGGNTNRTDLSEAECMRRWFLHHIGQTLQLRFILLDRTVSPREHFRALSGREAAGRPIHVFCEWTRGSFMAWLATRYFNHVYLHRVPFDSRSLSILFWIRQTFVLSPMEKVGFYCPLITRLNEWLRECHIRRARRTA